MVSESLSQTDNNEKILVSKISLKKSAFGNIYTFLLPTVQSFPLKYKTCSSGRVGSHLLDALGSEGDF